MNFLPDSDILNLLMGATLAVKMVMIFLALMSLWSWTIIFFKFFTIGAARKKVMQGYDLFMGADDLSSGLKRLGGKSHSPWHGFQHWQSRNSGCWKKQTSTENANDFWSRTR